MSDEDAEKLFLQEKPTLALLFIGSKGQTYASVISKEIDSTFAHTTRILSKMEQCGILKSTSEGRIKFVELTEYGKKVEAALKEFRNIAGKKIEEVEEEGKEKGAETGEGEKAEKREGPEREEEPGKGEESEEKKKSREEKMPVKELDPANSELMDKILDFKSRIEHIHREAVEHGENMDMISRKLGPCSRDVKKLRSRMEAIESPIDETVKKALDESAELLKSYLKA